MKKMILLIAGLFIATNLFAQILPQQRTFHYWNENRDSINSALLQNIPYFQYPTNEFVLGWHWGEAKYYTKALNMNFIHCPIDTWATSMGDISNLVYCLNNTSRYYSVPFLADSCRMIMRSSWIGGRWAGWNPKDAKAMHYIPTLQQDEMADTTMDLTNGFLGFRFKDASATISGTRFFPDVLHFADVGHLNCS